MEKMFKELQVSIDDVANVENEFALDRLLSDRAAEECGYHGTLEVSFDYWHFGRHAEHAAEQGMYVLAVLFSAAWHVRHRVLGNEDPVHKDAEKRSIIERYHAQVKRYREQVKGAQEAAT